MNARRPVHLCCWPGCRELRGAEHLLCRSHWDALPSSLRSAIQHARTPQTKAAAHQAALDWIKNKSLPTRDVAPAFSEPKEPAA